MRYENLTIEASAYVGGRALPTVLNSYLNFIEVHSQRGSMFGGLLHHPDQHPYHFFVCRVHY